MAIVAVNTTKERDPKTLLKSIHGDLHTGAWWKFNGHLWSRDKDGNHTIKLATVKNLLLDANIAMLRATGVINAIQAHRYQHEQYIAKTAVFGLHFCHRQWV